MSSVYPLFTPIMLVLNSLVKQGFFTVFIALLLMGSLFRILFELIYK